MKTGLRLYLLAASLVSLPPVAKADWKAVEKVEPYSIAGTSGAELYASIGERGPKVGVGRAVAYTNFKLTWSRKYEPRGETCVLASARPKLVITYALPEPSGQLPAAVRKSWDTFISGVRSHEKVHGDMIVQMVKEIETASVGLSVSSDPGCSKIRKVLTNRLSEISLAQRQRSRDFDRIELSDGGNIHKLILDLVNGP